MTYVNHIIYGGKAVVQKKVDWYDRRDELTAGMVFVDYKGAKVMLDHRVPGNVTQWYVADWWDGSWSYANAKIEPGDLVEWIADNDYKNVCRHCGRDNNGYEADRCSDDCPLFSQGL